MIGGPGNAGGGGSGGPRDPVNARGLKPEKSSAGSIDAMLKKRQAEDRLLAEEGARSRALLKKKLIKYGGTAAVATAVAFGSLATWAWYKHSREGCGATDERKRAVQAVMAQGDSAAGTAVGQRFPERKQYRCAEMAEPRGVLVAVKEDTGDSIVWFVDATGTPLNVNLLAASWTPRLGAGPPVEATDIARVTQ